MRDCRSAGPIDGVFCELAPGHPGPHLGRSDSAKISWPQRPRVQARVSETREQIARDAEAAENGAGC